MTSPVADLYARAIDRHGEEALRSRFPWVAADAELRAMGDDLHLAAMTKRVFAAGFRRQVIEAKWEGFEEAFGGFEPEVVASLDASAIDALASDTRIVRNRPKILATVNNARFVQDVSAEHGGFGCWLADWSPDDTVGLWRALKSGGDRLGGDTGPWFLRLVGKDTFRLSGDVVEVLIESGVATKKPTGKKALAAAQDAFNQWREESGGLSLGAVSVVLACSTGDIYVG